MNHLAHLFLSQSNIDLMIGNFIADQVKGKKLLDYSSGIQKGIEMHRAIDTFTDEHPIVMQSKERLFPKYHKYASVIVDMFYDHILAKNWPDYSPISLSSFTKSTYLILSSQDSILPESSQRALAHMKKHDWLVSYASLTGMNKAMEGLAYRAKFDSKMEEATIDLEKDYHLYKKEFEAFFPLLTKHVLSWTVERD